MTITLAHYLVLGAILFATSVVGIFLNRKNVIVLLMAIELMLLSVNMNFVAFSHYLGDMAGQVFVFFILTVAAAEAAIGLAILVVLFRKVDTINADDLDHLVRGDVSVAVVVCVFHDFPFSYPARLLCLYLNRKFKHLQYPFSLRGYCLRRSLSDRPAALWPSYLSGARSESERRRTRH